MRLFDENTFAEMYRSGAFRSVSLVCLDNLVQIRFVAGDGEDGFISVVTLGNKPKKVKSYRFESAARFLKSLGVVSVQLDLKNFGVAVF